jgi:hypothetical protein
VMTRSTLPTGIDDLGGTEPTDASHAFVNSQRDLERQPQSASQCFRIVKDQWHPGVDVSSDNTYAISASRSAQAMSRAAATRTRSRASRPSSSGDNIGGIPGVARPCDRSYGFDTGRAVLIRNPLDPPGRGSIDTQ